MMTIICQENVFDARKYILIRKQSSLKSAVPLLGHAATPILVQDEVQELHTAQVSQHLVWFGVGR